MTFEIFHPLALFLIKKKKEHQAFWWFKHSPETPVTK
jgi:hypothetical protein